MPALLVMLVILVASFVLVAQGVQMHREVPGKEAALHQLQSEYYALSQADRDIAPNGSILNQKHALIQQYPSELMELKMLGVGKILTGVFVMLFGILLAILMAPVRLAAMLNKKK